MYNVYGVICGTYEEACIVAGIETPAQLAYLEREENQAAWIREQDDIEAHGPQFHSPHMYDYVPF